MKLSRGDVVLVDMPFASGKGWKVRPALVVQNDRDNRRLTNVIVAMITTQTQRAHEPTQLFIDVATPDGRASGLVRDSVVNCVNLYTVESGRVLRVLGSLAASLMQRVNECLKVALDLS